MAEIEAVTVEECWKANVKVEDCKAYQREDADMNTPFLDEDMPEDVWNTQHRKDTTTREGGVPEDVWRLTIKKETSKCVKVENKGADEVVPIIIDVEDDPLNSTETSPETYEAENTCQLCSETFTSYYGLMKHMSVHSRKAPTQCELCVKGFATQEALLLHIMGHEKESDVQQEAQVSSQISSETSLSCKFCGKKFATSGNLLSHIKDAHDGINRARPVCSTGAQLPMHKVIQTGDRPFKCKFCSATYASQQGLVRHLLTHAKGNVQKQAKLESVKLNKCCYCKKEFTTLVQLSEHKKVHDEEYPFTCKNCPLRFKTALEKVHHMKSHNGKKYPCGSCPEAFLSRSELLIHVKSHKSLLHCKYCGQSGMNKSRLAEHMMRHTGEKPFECGFCKTRFVTKWERNNHTKTHTGERPFCCMLCGKSYITRSELNRHKCNGVNDSESRGKPARRVGPLQAEDKPFSCEYCTQSFATEPEKLRHIKTHMVGEFVCTMCPCGFSTPSELANHAILHAKSDIQCKNCSVTFESLVALRNHVCMLQSCKAQYKCKTCSKSFLSQIRLRLHSITHSQNK